MPGRGMHVKPLLAQTHVPTTASALALTFVSAPKVNGKESFVKLPSAQAPVSTTALALDQTHVNAQNLGREMFVTSPFVPLLVKTVGSALMQTFVNARMLGLEQLAKLVHVLISPVSMAGSAQVPTLVFASLEIGQDPPVRLLYVTSPVSTEAPASRLTRASALMENGKAPPVPFQFAPTPAKTAESALMQTSANAQSLGLATRVKSVPVPTSPVSMTASVLVPITAHASRVIGLVTSVKQPFVISLVRMVELASPPTLVSVKALGKVQPAPTPFAPTLVRTVDSVPLLTPVIALMNGRVTRVNSVLAWPSLVKTEVSASVPTFALALPETGQVTSVRLPSAQRLVKMAVFALPLTHASVMAHGKVLLAPTPSVPIPVRTVGFAPLLTPVTALMSGPGIHVKTPFVTLLVLMVVTALLQTPVLAIQPVDGKETFAMCPFVQWLVKTEEPALVPTFASAQVLGVVINVKHPTASSPVKMVDHASV